jgi:hypothetical protein
MNRRTVVAALGVAAVAAGGIAGDVVATSGPGSISLSASSSHARHGHSWSYGHHWVFNKIDNQNDPTFNQLLGINDRGQIAGYFGSGAAGHPNKGYLLVHHDSRFVNENVPTAVQTQVVGLNNTGVTVGFWSSQNTANEMNNNFGFYTWHGRFSNVNFPTANNANPPVNQLLGVNDQDVAVGFYNDARGNSHGYAYSIPGHRFARVRVHGATSVTASGINDRGDIVGFYTGPHGGVHGFVRERHHRNLVRLTVPGASSTMAFGINNRRQVVGTYTVGSGDAAKTFGFVWVPWRHGFATINAPHGSGTTTLNGINDAGDLVGFYTDAAGNTDGLLVSRFRLRHPPFTPGVMAVQPTTPAATSTASPTATPTAPATTPATTPTAVPTGTQPTHF